MNENTSNGPATPGPEPGGGLSTLLHPTWWVGILNAVKTPLGLLVLLALIGFSLFASLLYDSSFIAKLKENDVSSIIQIFGAVFLGIVAIVGIYVFRGGKLYVFGDRPPTDDPQYFLDIFNEVPLISSRLPVMKMTSDDMVVRQASRSALRFFGSDDTAPVDKFVGKNVGELIKHMQSWLDPPSAFRLDMGEDQARVMEKVKAGEITNARLPVRFNQTHPVFPNKTFVPIITERREIGAQDNKKTLLTILYLDVGELPKNLFSDRVWQEVIKDVHPEKIAEELKKIQTDLDKRYFRKDNDGGKLRRKALEDAIEKLEKGGSPAVLDDLSKTGWFVLREEAQSEAQRRPERPEVLNFIDAVLG